MPTSRAQNFFSSVKRELEIFYVFGGKVSEKPGAGPTTGTGNEKQRTLRKSIRSSPIFPHAPRTLCVLTDEMQMRPRKPLPV